MTYDQVSALGNYIISQLGDPARCSHTLDHSRQWLAEHLTWLTEYGETASTALRFLEANGGNCDCEVVFNVVIPAGNQKVNLSQQELAEETEGLEIAWEELNKD